MKTKLSSNDVFRRMAAMVCVLALTMIAPVSEAWAQTSGTCGDNLTWTLTENGETAEVNGHDVPAYDLTITGTGAMANYKSTTMPWYSNITKITNVTIGSGVTTIGDDAFYSCSNLRSVSIPTSVTSIGDYAFYYNKSLETVTFEANSHLTTIGNYAFQSCTKLSSITIPASVTSIGKAAFSDCTDLATITVDGGNSKYDSRNNCNAIIETTSNTLVVGCKGTIIPDGVTTIGDYAFQSCTKLSSITIPASVTSIGSMAFANCKALKSMVIPDGVETISGSLFQGCDSLRSVTLGPGVKNLARIFTGCPRLTVLRLKRYDSTDEYDPITRFPNIFDDCKGLAAVVVNEEGYEAYKVNWDNALISHKDGGHWDMYGDYGHVVRPDHEVLFKAGTTNLWTSWCDHIAHAAPEGAEVYTVERVEGTKVYLNRMTAMVEDPDGGGLRALIPAYIPVLIKRPSGTLTADLKMTYVSGGELTPENGWVENRFKTNKNYDFPYSSYYVPYTNSDPYYTVHPDIMGELPYGYFGYVNYQQKPVQESPNYRTDEIRVSLNNGNIYGNVGFLDYSWATNYSGYSSANRDRYFFLNGDKFCTVDQLDFGTIEIPKYAIPDDITPEEIAENPDYGRIHLLPLILPHRWRIYLNNAPSATELTLCINSSTPMSVGFAKEGYGTYYHRGADATLPAGMKARIVTAKGDGQTLTYETIADGDGATNTVPAGTAVMLQVAESTDAQTLSIDLTAKADNRTFAGNLLHGSDNATTTTGEGLHYKLTYGTDQTGNGGDDLTDVLGWYWGATDGAAFQSAAHKAWLALPASAGARGFIGLPGDDAAASISEVKSESAKSEEWFSLDGRRLNGRPSARGLYIHNGKIVVIK